MAQQQRDIKRKLAVFELARESRNVAKTCRRFGISRQAYYNRRRAYEKRGEAGLVNRGPCPENHALRIPKPIEETIVHLRLTYHFGPTRMAWYPGRYHGLSISTHRVYNVLVRNGISRLPTSYHKRCMPSKRYRKQVPGHHVQVDVKFLHLVDSEGRKAQRFQYTAIDDATRIRALRLYEKHTQANAIDFIDHVVECFPFRIHTVPTDNGHEFRTKLHWHVEDQGMRHVHIKPASPNLNGKVERSHLTDQTESYQLLDYAGDVDLRAKLAVWEEFYNVHRPHGGLGGLTPYEVLKEKMAS
jgi:transposase InsO family protein